MIFAMIKICGQELANLSVYYMAMGFGDFDNSNIDYVAQFGDKRPYRKNYRPVLRPTRRRMLSAQYVMLGLTTEQVVEKLKELGYEDATEAQVARDVSYVKQEWKAQAAAAYDDKVERENHKLDLLEEFAWDRIEDGGSENPVAEILAISARRAKLLGLDKPKRVAIGGDPDGTPIALMSDAALERFILAHGDDGPCRIQEPESDR